MGVKSMVMREGRPGMSGMMEVSLSRIWVPAMTLSIYSSNIWIPHLEEDQTKKLTALTTASLPVTPLNLHICSHQIHFDIIYWLVELMHVHEFECKRCSIYLRGLLTQFQPPASADVCCEGFHSEPRSLCCSSLYTQTCRRKRHSCEIWIQIKA